MWRVVDIAGDGRHLSLQRQHLVVSLGGNELGRVPLADIQSVIVHGHGATFTVDLAVALAREGVPLVLADSAHRPVALSLPVDGHFEHALRLRAQADASPARRDRIWRDIVMAKITAQAEALDITGQRGGRALAKFARAVEPGDPGNVEARAARAYWQRLFGPAFRRDRERGDVNGALNYGYTVLRAACARAIVASGLSAALGVHHRGRLNAMQLADDLMEPYRPLVDIVVWQNREAWADGLPSEGKAALVAITNRPINGPDGVTPLHRALGATALSLANLFLGSRKDLWLPPTLALPAEPPGDDHESETADPPQAVRRRRAVAHRGDLRVPGDVADRDV